MEPVFGLFLNNGVVCDVETEEPVEVTFPLVVQFACTDFRDGDGWGRGFVEQNGTTVLDEYDHSVSSSGETYAVTVQVPSLEELARLDERYEWAYERLDSLWD